MRPAATACGQGRHRLPRIPSSRHHQGSPSADPHSNSGRGHHYAHHQLPQGGGTRHRPRDIPMNFAGAAHPRHLDPLYPMATPESSPHHRGWYGPHRSSRHVHRGGVRDEGGQGPREIPCKVKHTGDAQGAPTPLAGIQKLNGHRRHHYDALNFLRNQAESRGTGWLGIPIPSLRRAQAN